ncbi:PPOX class F420-dependent oxidoreductase [Rhodococcus sp. NPDC003318]|uniref:PPOX class F420-dependent oxidoreductase n=1 Tax=Rhodococcus sp. NPDC003318 TaxID=3364503 RepID=UPI00367FD3C8
MTEQTPPDALTAAKVVLLETRKRDGTWVNTPVNIATDGAHAYFRTPGRASKNKRLRNFPDVRVAPCTWSGKATGPESVATAHLLSGADADAAARAIDHRFPILQRMIVRATHKVMRTPTLHYELTDFHSPD